MSLGRLIMPALRWRDDSGFEHEHALVDQALGFGAGGFIVFGGTRDAVSALTRDLEARAGRPLLIGADLERGAGQQVRGLREVPPPRALASLDDPEAERLAGALTGSDARSVGINWVFAPVADLDIAPENPIVQTRSFGDDPERVAGSVVRWLEGCQAAGALASVKHFPGHGRTVVDSHDRLPEVVASRDELLRSDLRPFAAAIGAGVASVMTAHVTYPGLDPSGLPATLSPTILGLLRRELGFDGLVVSDALIMKGAFGARPPATAAVDAIAAGVDLLLYPVDPGATRAELDRRAGRDRALRDRIEGALGRYERALERARGRTPEPAPAGDAGPFAARLVRAGAPAPALRAPIELLVVDDDLDGAWPASPSDYAARALAGAGVGLGPGGGGSRVVLVFAEPRASKGRAGLGPASRARLAASMPADVLVLFGHPRLRVELPVGPPVIVAWHRQRLMQEAVAGWIRERLG